MVPRIYLSQRHAILVYISAVADYIIVYFKLVIVRKSEMVEINYIAVI